MYMISLAQWSQNRAIKSGELDHLDFAPGAMKRFGIDAVEYVNTLFGAKPTDDYLKQMRTRADDAGVSSLLIMCDGLGRLGDPDAGARAKAVDNHKPWLHAASALGCHSIRVNAASSGTWDEQMALAADGLARLTTIAASDDLNVIVENHGGLSSNGAWLAATIKKVGMDRCGTLPDFGNFKLSSNPDEWYDRYQGVTELMPYAKAVSAKSHDFDAEGNETHTDYQRMMKIVVDAGYQGYVGIEYEGRDLSEHDGILATKRLLERVRKQLEDA